MTTAHCNTHTRTGPAIRHWNTALAGSLLILATTQAALADQPGDCSQGTGCSGSTCISSITGSQAAVPQSACPKFGEFQGGVDVFSWNLFLALNWPADSSTCTADTGKSILDVTSAYDGELVWQTFSTDAEVFVGSGKPVAWCDGAARADLQHVGKSNPVASAAIRLSNYFGNNISEAVGGVLTDQNGRFVRYELLVNETEYDYIVNNNLWNHAGQKGATVDFPTASVEIKAAWKVLSESEIDGGTFYTRMATVYNDAKGNPSPGKNPVTVGLVGLHMVFKDPALKHLWASFEHVSNAPATGTTDMAESYSFYNPDCSTDCVQNKQNASTPYTELDTSGNPINAPTQVVRTQPLDKNDPGIADLNTYYRNLLAGSVFENYELIGTQWSTGGAPAGTPATLANTTLETYIQAHSPLVQKGTPVSSCIGCHKFATTTTGSPADFSFLLSEAQDVSEAADD